MKKSLPLFALLFLGISFFSYSQSLSTHYERWGRFPFYLAWSTFSEQNPSASPTFDQSVSAWSIWFEIANYEDGMWASRWEYQNDFLEGILMWGTSEVLGLQSADFKTYGGDLASATGFLGRISYGLNVVSEGDLNVTAGGSFQDAVISTYTTHPNINGNMSNRLDGYHIGAGLFGQVDYAVNSAAGVRFTSYLNKAFYSNENEEGSGKPWLITLGGEYFLKRLFFRVEAFLPSTSSVQEHNSVRFKLGFR